MSEVIPFPQAGWLGSRIRRWISRKLSDRKPGKRLPSSEQMEALRQKFAKHDQDRSHAH